MTQTIDGLRVIQRSLQVLESDRPAICLDPLKHTRVDAVLEDIGVRLQADGFTPMEIDEARVTIDHVNEILTEGQRELVVVDKTVDNKAWLGDMHPDALRNLGSLSIAYEHARNKGLLDSLQIDGTELVTVAAAETLVCGALMKWRPRQRKRPDLALHVSAAEIAQLLADYPEVPLTKTRRLLYRLRHRHAQMRPILDILIDFPELSADQAMKRLNDQKTGIAALPKSESPKD